MDRLKRYPHLAENLRGANLVWIDLHGIDLQWRDLSGALLRGANLARADLRATKLAGADLHGADLHGADLRGAELSGANLSNANLSGIRADRAKLAGANLAGAKLHEAFLLYADLAGANLAGADLSRAVLVEADLTGCDLRFAGIDHAEFDGAIFAGVRLPDFQICPSSGSFRGWKQALNSTDLCVIALEIPADAQRVSCLTTRDCRADKALVISGEGLSPHEEERAIFYQPGKMVVADAWDPDIRTPCASGIHFYLTRQEAEEGIE